MIIKRKTLIEILLCLVILFAFFPLLKSRLATFLNNKAVDYYNDGERDKAIQFFKRALKIAPNPKANFNLANAYQEKGMFKESIVEYKKALKQDPKQIQIYSELAYCYTQDKMYPQAIASLRAAQSLGVLTAEEELKQLHIEYICFLFNQATDYYIEENKSQAESVLKKLINNYHNFSFAYKLLGDIKAGENLFLEAIANYKKAIASGLTSASIFNIYNDMGICYMRIEDYPNAVKYLRIGHQIEPANAHLLYNLARTLRDNRSYEEALGKYKQLEQLRFDYPNLHNDMAEIYHLKGETEQANQKYKTELELVKAELSQSPEDIYNLNRLAISYNGLQLYKQAKETINQAIQIDPHYGESFFTRAKIYENLGKTTEAIEDLKKAKEFFVKSGFIDNYIFRLETKITNAKDVKFFYEDTIIFLRNGHQIKGKLKSELDEEVIMDVLVNESFGTVIIRRQDIKELKKIE